MNMKFRVFMLLIIIVIAVDAYRSGKGTGKANIVIDRLLKDARNHHEFYRLY